MRRQARKGGGRQLELTIEAIGTQGDGIGFDDGRPVFVPQTVAGDRLLVRLEAEKGGGFRGEALELLQEGPGRAEPPCPHYGPCGGCALQHLDETHYRAWKEALLPEALGRQGLPTEGLLAEGLRPTVFVPPGTRRRATFALRRQGARMELGFHRRRSHELVDLQACLLLTPALFALTVPLRRLLAELLPAGLRGDAVVLEAENGFDLLLVTPEPPDLAAREALAAFAEAEKVVRLSWAPDLKSEPEPVIERAGPLLTFGRTPVVPPPGGFVQPSREGEAALTAAVLEALPEGVGRVADLFAGCGSFTFALAERAQVTAVEGDAAALAALWTAARRGGLAGPVMVEQRDLVRQPLLAGELSVVEALVFDPPRQGAREQAAEIAASGVPTVIAVSCSPTSFARDARLLVEGGYRLDWIQPVDQFPWAAHLELVARFSR